MPRSSVFSLTIRRKTTRISTTTRRPKPFLGLCTAQLHSRLRLTDDIDIPDAAVVADAFDSVLECFGPTHTRTKFVGSSRRVSALWPAGHTRNAHRQGVVDPATNDGSPGRQKSASPRND